MDIEIKSCLFDIHNAIREIDSFFSDQVKTFENYSKDIKTKRAVERNLEIIGEAVSRILKINSDFQISNSRKIIDTRNKIIHSYDNVSDEIVWGIIINHLPKLKSEIDSLLNN